MKKWWIVFWKDKLSESHQDFVWASDKKEVEMHMIAFFGDKISIIKKIEEKQNESIDLSA